MKDFYEELGNLCETIEHEIRDANEKIKKANGKMSAGDLEYVDKLTHTLKSIKTAMAMMDGGYSNAMHYNDMGGHSYGRYDGDNSYNDGPYHGGSFARNIRRDSMGRYSRANESMVHELRELMQDAPDERTRQEFQRFISKIESMG